MNRSQSLCSRLPALLSLLVLFGTSSAFGQTATRGLGVVIVPGKGTDEARVLEVKPTFRRYLRLLEGVTLKDPSVLLAPGAESELTSQVNAAFSALNTKDFAGARQVLAGIEERMLGLPASDDTIFLARFYKAYGCALVGSGLVQEGVARIKTSLFLFGEQSVDEYGYSPDTRDSFLQAKREIEDLPSGGLELSSVPNRAEIYIDGKFAGISPLKLDRLPQGNHPVRAAVPGHEQRFQLVQVASGSRSPSVIQLTPTAFASALAGPEARLEGASSADAAAPDMAALKSSLSADELAFVVLTEEPAAFVAKGFYTNKDGKTFDVDDRIEKGGAFSENVKNFVAYLTGAQVRDEAKVTSLGRPLAVLDSTAAAALESGDELILDPNSPMFAELKKKKEQKSILTEWWFITSVAVLVAGAGTGVYFLTRSTGASSSDATGSLRVDVHPY
jgi:hypothetical protein